jgi:hypothetical protein
MGKSQRELYEVLSKSRRSLKSRYLRADGDESVSSANASDYLRSTSNEAESKTLKDSAEGSGSVNSSSEEVSSFPQSEDEGSVDNLNDSKNAITKEHLDSQPKVTTTNLHESESNKQNLISISLEAALAIFISVCIVCGTAFYLGYRDGLSDVLGRIGSQVEIENKFIEKVDGIPPNADKLKEHRRENVALPSEAYVLRLKGYDKSPQSLTRAKEDVKYLNGQKILAKLKLNVYLLVNSSALSVCVGSSWNRHSAGFEEFRKAASAMRGPSTSREKNPYAGCFVERVEKLGRVYNLLK